MIKKNTHYLIKTSHFIKLKTNTTIFFFFVKHLNQPLLGNDHIFFYSLTHLIIVIYEPSLKSTHQDIILIYRHKLVFIILKLITILCKISRNNIPKNFQILL